MVARSVEASDDENEEERSRQIRIRREQAERDLLTAKETQRINSIHDNHDFPDDDEDTFNDVDIPDLDAPLVR